MTSAGRGAEAGGSGRDAVQLAARLCGAAAPGTVVVSTAVRELCIGKRLEFDCSGRVPLKGFPEPVQIHQVIWQ